MERRLRIGELSARTDVRPDTLRVWERRYGLLEPSRSDGGFRLYAATDEQRVHAMVRYLEAGTPAGEAARLVLEGGGLPDAELASLPALCSELRGALDRFDDSGAQSALDALMTRLSFETVARGVILPYLRDLGERWEQGDASVAQEHFATSLIQGRLLALARGWDRGVGPRALLACAPDELHELGLLIFGLTLRQYGWRITFLGADTPVETLRSAAHQLAPVAVVLIAMSPRKLEPLREPLTQLAQSTRLLLGGAGAHEAFAAAVGAELASGDPLETAADLAGGQRPTT
jgi:MerR family transcriptional regulator, light-induced transcriptional regulator